MASESPIWKGTRAWLEFPKNQICWSIDASDLIRLGLDPWVLGSPEMILRLNSPSHRNGRWNSQLIISMFHPDEAKCTSLWVRQYKPLYCKARNGKNFLLEELIRIFHRDSLLINCSKRQKLKLTPHISQVHMLSSQVYMLIQDSKLLWDLSC